MPSRPLLKRAGGTGQLLTNLRRFYGNPAGRGAVDKYLTSIVWPAASIAR